MEKKLERRIAYYADGSMVEGKTRRKSFKTDNLIGVISVYKDGTREKEALEASQPLSKRQLDTNAAKYARLMLEANLQFKHDGGGTPETKALLRKL